MIYIFCGNDYEKIKTKYNLLITAQNLRISAFDSVKDMCTHLYQTALISQNIAYCVRYDLDFINAEDAWANIAEAAKDKTIILIYNELDKRSKFYKFFKDNIADFNLEEEDNPVFGYSRSVCKNKLADAICYADSIEQKDIIYTFNLLYNRIRKILQIQATPKDVRLFVNTGLQDSERYKNSAFLNIYTEDDLQYMLTLILYITEEIKAGYMPIEKALYYFIICLT